MQRISPRLHNRITPRSLLLGGALLFMVGMVMLNIVVNRPIASPGSVVAADSTNAQLVAQGKLVYAARCASCHGANLEGQPNWQQARADGTMPAPPHDATGHTWHHSDLSLFTTVKQGGQATAPPGYTSSMPAFGNVLSDEDIYAVLAYIKSTWPPQIQAAQRQGHQ